MSVSGSKEPLAQFLKKPPKKGVVGIVGDLALDRFVFGGVDRVSPEAPVLVLKKEKAFDKLGCAANVMANVASLALDWDIELHCFGFIGKDRVSEESLDRLRGLKSKTHLNFVESEQWVTPLKTRFLAGSQHQLLRVDEEESADLPEGDYRRLMNSIKSKINLLDVLIVQDYAKGTLPKNILLELFKLCREKGVYTIVDPNRKTPLEWYSNASLLTPNVDEAEALTRMKLSKGSADEMAAEACVLIKKQLNLEEMILTRGKYGMSVLGHDLRIHHLPALALSVFDVTGAGDTVVAMLAAAKACGADTVQAAHLANMAASIVVSKVGTASVSVDELLGRDFISV